MIITDTGGPRSAENTIVSEVESWVVMVLMVTALSI
jgi:hypothetical protein